MGVRDTVSLKWHARKVDSHQIYHFSFIPDPTSILQLHFWGSGEFAGTILPSLGLTSAVFSCSAVN